MLFLILSLLFPTLFANPVSKLVTLTPSVLNKNGIELTTNNNVITTANAWDIHGSDTDDWHLSISMSDSWSILPDRPSILSLKTYSSNTDNTDIIVTFSQNTNKYISSKIKINGNTAENSIYPYCAHNPADIASMAETLRESDYSLIESDMTSITNESPLQIQLINDPIHDWTKYKYLNQECIFESFSDIPIDIYIASADIGHILSIYKVEITLQYNETEISQTETMSPHDTDTDNETSLSDSLPLNTKTIVYILIGITVCLLVVCIALTVMVRKQSLENERFENEQNANDKVDTNIQIAKIMAMEGNDSISEIDINIDMNNLMLHTSAFHKEDQSKTITKSAETIESNGGYEDDDEVMMDIMWTGSTAGQ